MPLLVLAEGPADGELISFSRPDAKDMAGNECFGGLIDCLSEGMWAADARRSQTQPGRLRLVFLFEQLLGVG